MFLEMLAKLLPSGVIEYLRQLAGYPAETFIRLSPAAPLAVYFAWRGRIVMDAITRQHTLTAAAVALLCYLPYWLAPHSAIRYLTPVYPMAAVVLALVILSAGAQALEVTRRWLIAIIVLKLVAVLLLFPFYQSHYRGENYLAAADRIMQITKGQPLYNASDTAAGPLRPLPGQNASHPLRFPGIGSEPGCAGRQRPVPAPLPRSGRPGCPG